MKKDFNLRFRLIISTIGFIVLLFTAGFIEKQLERLDPIKEYADCYNEFGGLERNQEILYSDGDYYVLSGTYTMYGEIDDKDCDRNVGICWYFGEIGTNSGHRVIAKSNCLREGKVCRGNRKTAHGYKREFLNTNNS